ncbi:TIGR02281 family clan AA aspartic protease [uncultured Parasphingorhabdus sp.]|uniref:TIGR02281 family clan AA aspartic protease n=1 Tax=uncultured Parasphingorhabdus sp. TaxID=2709694 RepID=UPI002AA6605C|nr:TIGR02281 family clan AA aspartic protease [uncultured Parasphingorhabdus sp.]
MTEDQNINLVFAIGALVLVASALFSRRIGLGEIVRTALVWVAIFGLFIVGFSYKQEILAVWSRVSGELNGSHDQVVVGETLRIRQSADGHFWVDAKVNATPVRFLIDSGATTTAMALRTAQAADIDISSSPFPVVLSTANGSVEAQRGVIQSIQVGPLKMQDLPVVVAEEFGDANVIGMNFLSKLGSWRVAGGEMVLEPATPDNR